MFSLGIVSKTTALLGSIFLWGNDSTSSIRINTETVTEELSFASNLLHISISPDKLYFYGGTVGSTNINKYSMVDGSILATWATGVTPQAWLSPICKISPDGLRLYVGGNLSGTVSCLSTVDGTNLGLVTGVPSGTGKLGVDSLCVSPDGLYLYITYSSSALIHKVSTVTLASVNSASVPSLPQGVNISPDGLKLVVSSVSNVTVLNSSSLAVIGSSIGSSSSLNGIVAFTQDSTYVYIALPNTNQIQKINCVSGTLTSTLTPGLGYLFAQCKSTSNGRIFVSSYTNRVLYEINLTTDAVTVFMTLSGSGTYFLDNGD